jgi:hypothetical protein
MYLLFSSNKLVEYYIFIHFKLMKHSSNHAII